MIKNDYSKKIGERFNSLLNKINELKLSNKNTLPEIDNGFKEFLGISSGFANSISKIDLIKLLRTNSIPDGNKLTIAAKLLTEEGKLSEENNDIESAYYKYEKAFTLIFIVFDSELECNIINYREIADEIAELLSEYELGEETVFKIYKYYRLTGNYAEAENHIFQLIAEEEDKEKYKAEVCKFYEALLEKSDSEIESGNLTREEIQNSLKEIKNS